VALPIANPPVTHRHAVAPPSHHGTTSKPDPASPAPVTTPPAPSSDPAPAAATPTTATDAAPPPDTTPTLPPEPASVARVSAFSPYGNGGFLDVAYDDGSAVSAFAGEHTTIVCDRVSGGRLVSSAPCGPGEIAPNRRLVRADHETNASSGKEVWTVVEIILDA
jgi:hypothetical protein